MRMEVKRNQKLQKKSEDNITKGVINLFRLKKQRINQRQNNQKY